MNDKLIMWLFGIGGMVLIILSLGINSWLWVNHPEKILIRIIFFIVGLFMFSLGMVLSMSWSSYMNGEITADGRRTYNL